MIRHHDTAAQELSRVLREHRPQAAEAFASALRHTRRWPATLDEAKPHWDAFLRDHFFAWVDYLAQYFAGNDTTFKQLFVGEKIKALYDDALEDAERKAQARAVAAAERQQLEALLRTRLSAAAWSLLEAQLRAVEQLLTGEAPRVQRVLLIGDCLILDIVPFIVGDLMEAGVAIVPDYATAKNPAELRDQLRRLSRKKFDIVFCSPFSYEFSVEYSQLSHWRNAMLVNEEVHRIADDAWAQAQQTLDLAADLFDCPIHVHNSSAVIREENAIKRRLKLAATARVRHAARHRVNELLSRHVERKNAESFRHLFVLDELAIVQQVGEREAGAFHYRAAVQHPAQLGRFLAARYVDILFVNAHLLTRKLIVSDLDHTLWDGIIGEGEVTHHHERQRLLKGLKQKGVVLAILSKNDPASVHWSGGTLSEEDFVCTAISWDPKVQGMRRIQSQLNLKMKDFVFIDDREDELELIRTTCAEVVCLNATQAATWARLALWQAQLDEDEPEMDRTLMYRQREERKAFAAADLATDSEKAALFATLQLKLTIAAARPGDLKRVAELINRTNQFNLEGSRTTLKEVQQWHAAPDHHLLIGQTADRFGDMGTTCVAIVRIVADRMELLPFVLSCRVFGYGIERSMMNHLKALAANAGLRAIVGRYVETPQNAPCRDFLSDNGFREDAGHWVFEVDGAAPPAVQWLRVEVATA